MKGTNDMNNDDLLGLKKIDASAILINR